MKKTLNIQTLIILLSLMFFNCSKVNDELEPNFLNDFTNEYHSFHNEYYKNNNIKSVVATFIDTPSRQNIYNYNKQGDLFKIEVLDLDYKNIIEYKLVYENNNLIKREYDNALLTVSIFEYKDNTLIKISDYRNEELFYF